MCLDSYLTPGTAQLPPGATLLPPSKFLWTGVLTYCQPQILTFRASALVGTVKMPVTTFTTTWELDDGTSGVMVTRLLLYKIYLPLIMRNV